MHSKNKKSLRVYAEIHFFQVLIDISYMYHHITILKYFFCVKKWDTDTAMRSIMSICYSVRSMYPDSSYNMTSIWHHSPSIGFSIFFRIYRREMIHILRTREITRILRSRMLSRSRAYKRSNLNLSILIIESENGFFSKFFYKNGIRALICRDISI